MSQLKILRVTLLALASALIWNLIWIALGYSVGTNWNIVKEKMAQILLNYNIAILVALGLGGVIFGLKILSKRHRRQKNADH